MVKRWLRVLVFSTMLGLSACTLGNSPVDTSKQQAQQIIDALEQYRAHNSAYPSGLSELVPQFLSGLPLTAEGEQFTYDTDTDHGYILGFTTQQGLGCGYIGEYKTWECSKGAP